MSVGRHGLTIAIVLTSACWLASDVAAHVGPSEAVNNRYYKLTPMSDRVRLAYAIFFGREPSLATRRQMDGNRDGMLSSAEVDAYAKVIAEQLHASVSFEYEGRPVAIQWQDIHVGMSDYSLGGGPFSVDFVGSVCLDVRELGSEHGFSFSDRMRLPKPGETELSLAPAPGIRITQSEFDGKPTKHNETWQGGPGPAQTGYRFAFVVESHEMAVLDKSCEPKGTKRSRVWILLALAGAGVLSAIALAVWWRRRARSDGAR